MLVYIVYIEVAWNGELLFEFGLFYGMDIWMVWDNMVLYGIVFLLCIEYISDGFCFV